MFYGTRLVSPFVCSAQTRLVTIMRNYKFKTRVKILLLITLIAFIIFQSVDFLHKNEPQPPSYTLSEDFFARTQTTPPPKMRTFQIVRNENEEEIQFNILKKPPERVVFKQIQHEKLPSYDPVIFKQMHDNLQQKIVHIDLKGAPPRLDYLKSLLPRFKRLGVTGLLIEYEDMFPYSDGLKVISADNAYNSSELIEFLTAAKERELEIIPLIQTFGHMEYVLKLREFRFMREVDEYPDSICPSNNRSDEFLTEMLNQIITFHSKISSLRWIHLGCDEVYHINECSSCRLRKINSRQIFIEHVLKLTRIVRSFNPEIRPLIWDDMLRIFSPRELENSGLGKIVEPVVWVYSSNIRSLVPDKTWYQYTRIFPNIWIASAYKGASGATSMTPKLRKHYENHLAWLNFVNDYRIAGTNSNYKFRGIILTGWSRYDHFSVLCETLPVSIPSLVLNLILINTYLYQKNPKQSSTLHRDVFIKWTEDIHCSNRLSLFVKNNFGYLKEIEEKLYTCTFKGNRLYNDLKYLLNFEDTALNFHINNSYKTNGLLFYNIRHNLISVQHVRDVVKRAKRYKKDLNTLEQLLRNHTREFFDKSVTDELIEYRLDPLMSTFDRIINATETMKFMKIWNKRPY